MAKRDGFEPTNDKPVALPVGYKPPTEADRLHGLMSRLIVDMHGRSDVESLDESLDFDTGDDDGDEMFASRGVSQSEIRYMQEESLLTDAIEADRVVRHRRDALTWKGKYYGKDKSGRKRSDAGGNGDGEERSGDGAEKRGEGGEKGGQSAGSAGSVGESGKKV